MPGFSCVHHIEIGVQDGQGTVDMLRQQFTFNVQATRSSSVADQWLMVKNNTRFLITCLKTGASFANVEKDDYVIDWTSPAYREASRPHVPPKDSVFNIAFQVRDINACVQRFKDNDIKITKPLRTVKSAEHGYIQAITVKSYVGDIHHTLFEKNNYSGQFLPGFTPVDNTEAELDCNDNNLVSQNKDSEYLDSALEQFDHVALAVEMGTSMEVIDWYERCLGMKRFLINENENNDEGLILSTNDVGLRLRAMEYWKCAEVGLLTTEENMPGTEPLSRLSMVIAEGLPPLPGSQEANQIERWMEQHGGPGVQHVAITSSDIKKTVCNLKKRGAIFANPPPPAYYTEVGRLPDIIQAGEDAEILKENGILIDTEADGIHSDGLLQRTRLDSQKETYLLQVFTKPMLKSDPFFLELIQREGATGFGSGNVAALYRSIQSHIVGETGTKKDIDRQRE